jgi:hypothetical protein
MLEVLGSNLSQETNYHKVFRYFLQSLREKLETIHPLGQ